MGFIYIGHDERFTKVGLTRNQHARFNRAVTDNPSYKVISTYEYQGDLEALESEIHQQLSQCFEVVHHTATRSKSEWYRAKPELVVPIIESLYYKKLNQDLEMSNAKLTNQLKTAETSLASSNLALIQLRSTTPEQRINNAMTQPFELLDPSVFDIERFYHMAKRFIAHIEGSQNQKTNLYKHCVLSFQYGNYSYDHQTMKLENELNPHIALGLFNELPFGPLSRVKLSDTTLKYLSNITYGENGFTQNLELALEYANALSRNAPSRSTHFKIVELLFMMERYEAGCDHILNKDDGSQGYLLTAMEILVDADFPDSFPTSTIEKVSHLLERGVANEVNEALLIKDRMQYTTIFEDPHTDPIITQIDPLSHSFLEVAAKQIFTQQFSSSPDEVIDVLNQRIENQLDIHSSLSHYLIATHAQNSTGKLDENGLAALHEASKNNQYATAWLARIYFLGEFGVDLNPQVALRYASESKNNLHGLLNYLEIRKANHNAHQTYLDQVIHPRAMDGDFNALFAMWLFDSSVMDNLEESKWFKLLVLAHSPKPSIIEQAVYLIEGHELIGQYNQYGLSLLHHLADCGVTGADKTLSWLGKRDTHSVTKSI